jgi:hypothetical protein
MPLSPARTLDHWIGYRDGLSAHHAESRTAAYVYGNVLTLAAVAGESSSAVAGGSAALVLAGTVLSTYVAHVLAHSLAALLVTGPRIEQDRLRDVLRDGVPVLSSGAVPLALLVGGWLGWPSPAWAQALALVLVLVRVGGIGLVYRHLHPTVSLRRSLVTGLVAALVAGVVVLIKVLATH